MLEQIPWKVESALERFLRNQEPHLEVVGTSSPTLMAGLLSSDRLRLQRPNLVILPSQKEVDQMVAAFQFFSPGVPLHVLSHFDVGPYSFLYPNRRSVAGRLRWLWFAQSARPGDVFLASVEALVQKTLPFDDLHSRAQVFERNLEWPEKAGLWLDSLGYTQVPLVEDVGTYAVRGGMMDVYSPAHDHPVRIELFGDLIDSLRFFDPNQQKSVGACQTLIILPTHEILFTDENRMRAARRLKADLQEREGVSGADAASIQHQLAHGSFFQGVEFILSYFYERPALPIEHFSCSLNVWKLDPFELTRAYDQLISIAKNDFDEAEGLILRPHPQEIYGDWENLNLPEASQDITFTKVRLEDHGETATTAIAPLSTSDLKELSKQLKALGGEATRISEQLSEKLRAWKQLGLSIFISVQSVSQAQRLLLLLERHDWKALLVGEDEYHWPTWIEEQKLSQTLLHIIPRQPGESLYAYSEELVILRYEDLFSVRGANRARQKTPEEADSKRALAFNFGDLKVGDLIVHKEHGIGVFDGLKVMSIQGVDAEFIQIQYKGKDRLYLPVYRVHLIQRYSGPQSPSLIDKLGGNQWEKAKQKVRSHLRDIAAELLQIYAKRQVMEREPCAPPNEDYINFETSFPYQETDDQMKAIEDVLCDMQNPKPMDRLICGDVGYGKTEVAMRAAFYAVQNLRQVAIFAPTTVLTFQHFENFKKRFGKWPIEIRSLNRFVPKTEIKRTLDGLKEGTVDIVIGTHRMLSQDVNFKNLGLLVIDEEQRFGVKHKERLRKMKAGVDTIAMSATPIPRTLNMSLMGIRDLSLINTAPMDRLPSRTFVTKFNEDTIRKAVMSEVARGGQIYFIHNRIQSIYELSDRLKEMLPDVRFKVAHGQMEEGELEKVMIEFFHHEIDMLLCTTIVESGMDVASANTMFIDQSQQLGLSQLYQLRGRVGRSKERAYCYLLVPNHGRLEKDAQERLKIIQENSALGSGIRIAQYDLEMRGAGDILGEDQAGHVNTVGYELYLELLEEAVHRAKGETEYESGVEPEINVRIPALIPDSFIPDLRIRLAYYKSLSEIREPDDIDRIEDELRDQFGKLPDPVLNLMGLMLIRKVCKDLSVRDLSQGEAAITLAFTDKTTLKPERVIQLASQSNKKYSITPDNRLRVRVNEITWPRIYEELLFLTKQ